MKTVPLIITALALCVAGCADTQMGAFKTNRFLANLQFDKATGEVYETDSTGKTNHYEKWNVEGLKSDTQKALQTLDKALDMAKTIAEKAP